MYNRFFFEISHGRNFVHQTIFFNCLFKSSVTNIVVDRRSSIIVVSHRRWSPGATIVVGGDHPDWLGPSHRNNLL